LVERALPSGVGIPLGVEVFGIPHEQPTRSLEYLAFAVVLGGGGSVELFVEQLEHVKIVEDRDGLG
jgi:hypothetical protein